MKRLFIPIILIVFIIAVSCTPQRKLIYLQHENVINEERLIDTTYLLRVGDVLTVNVHSINEKAMMVFGQSPNNFTSIYNSESSVYHTGFIVCDSGKLNFPLIGSIKSSGRTIKDVSDESQQKLREYFPDALVNMKLNLFNFTVIGEVKNPGNFRVLKSRLNVFEAIAIAGDMTTFGRREVYLVRNTSQGPQIVELDLQNQNTLKSAHFYLMPHDIVYVKPHKAKILGFEAVPIGIILSSISTILVIINFLR